MADDRKREGPADPAGLSMSLEEMSKGKRRRDDYRSDDVRNDDDRRGGGKGGGGYSDRGYGDRGRGDRGYDDRGRSDRGHGDRGYNDRGRNDRGYGDRGYNDRGGGGGGRGYNDRGYGGGGKGYGGGGGGGGDRGYGGGYGGGGGGGKRPRHGGGHWRDGKAASASAAVPAPKCAGEQLDSEGHLWFDEASGVCTYFQDRRRKWPFYTGPAGKAHLVALVAANATLRERNAKLLEQAGEPSAVSREGERLYVEKPTLRGDANVTWSFDEYGHPGLQLYYLKLKSWQVKLHRFTASPETYLRLHL